MNPVVLAVALTLGMNLDANPAFEAAQALYRDLEFEDAAVKFDALASDAANSSEDRARAYVWVGMCFAGTGEEQKARAALSQAIELHEELELPEIAPPKVRQIVDEVRADVAAKRAAEAAAAPPTAADPAPSEVADAQPDELPILLISGGATAGLGVVALVGGGALVGLSLVTIGDCGAQADAGGFQSDVGACLDTANTEVGVGIGLAAVGGALAAVGGALLAFDVLAE